MENPMSNVIELRPGGEAGDPADGGYEDTEFEILDAGAGQYIVAGVSGTTASARTVVRLVL
jgi:hypothetical protein